MGDSLLTRPSLLLRLRDAGDAEAWARFVDLYAPLIHGFCRKQGLQDADAADITQDVLRKVLRATATWEYDPRRGSFRGWLFTVVRNRLRDFRATRKLDVPAGGSEERQALEAQPDPALGLEELWERDYRQNLFAVVAAQVKGDFQDSTWQAFWLTAVEGRTPTQVAAELRLSVAAVYLAKSRVMARLKERVRDLQEP